MKSLKIRIAEIFPPEISMRQTFDQEKMEELKKSIQGVGLINPVTLRKAQKGYEILAGHRRVVACKELGWVEIPAIVYTADGADGEKIKLAENLIRQDVDVIDEGFYLSQIKEKFGLSQKELAEMINKTESYVSERLRAVTYHPELKRVVKEGLMVFSVARELARLDDENQIIACINSALDFGTTPDQARTWVKNYKAQRIIEEDSGPIKDLSSDDSNIQASRMLQTCQICSTPHEPQNMYYISLCRTCRDTLANAK